METTDNESLVDGKLLSYSYLEAGIIETLATYVLLLLFLGIKILILFNNRLVAYFVVFFRNGFTPSDLVRAQKSGSM
jgi:sodium/potassium-transporting ATPase subunit alpha